MFLLEDELLQDLKKRRKQITEMGGISAVERQHHQGKMTARERIQFLLDENSFIETGEFVERRCSDFSVSQKTVPADAVVTGYGQVAGRPAAVFAQDFTSHGGTMGEMGAEKICGILDRALRVGMPVIGILDSGGARIQEGADALAGFGKIFYRNVQCSGRIPQISIIAGPCAGGATYSPALTDFIIMVEHTGKMFVTGPAVVAALTGEKVNEEELGSARVHAAVSGVAHFLVKDDKEAIATAKKLLSYLPSSAGELPVPLPYRPDNELRAKLNELFPKCQKRQYDIHDVITEIADPGSFMEMQELFAQNIVVGFARMGGKNIGIVANQPGVLKGYLDIDASDKAARFVEVCDSFHLPLLTLVDVPGFYPGVRQEHAGVIRHGAKMLHAYAAARTLKITVIIGEAYGGGYLAMGCRHIGADIVFAWPGARIAVMQAAGAVDVLYKKELKKLSGTEAAKYRKEMTDFYKERFDSPYPAASRGYVDAVIEPAETRKCILSALDVLQMKQKKGFEHRNMPL